MAAAAAAAGPRAQSAEGAAGNSGFVRPRRVARKSFTGRGETARQSQIFIPASFLNLPFFVLYPASALSHVEPAILCPVADGSRTLPLPLDQYVPDFSAIDGWL